MTRPSSSERDGAGPADMPRQPVSGGMVPPLSDSPDPSRSLGDGLSCDPAVMELELRAPRQSVEVGPGRPDAYELGGVELPSVTEVLDDWHPGGVDGLCQWAHKTALGDPVKGVPGSHWRIVRDQAGDFGTAMHGYCTRLDLGEDPEEIARQAEAEWSQEGRHAFTEYERWKALAKPDYSHMEFPLFSKVYGFAGTFDRRERDGTVGDLKGSKKSRATMIAQLGGYAQLLAENGYGLPPRGWLLHFPRELVDPNTNKVRTIVYRSFDSATLLAGRDAFLRALELHRLGKVLDGALKARRVKR